METSGRSEMSHIEAQVRHGSNVWHTKEHVGDPEEKCQSQERHLAKVLCTRAFLEAGSPGQRKTLSDRERRAAFMFLRKAQRRVLCLRGKEKKSCFLFLEAGSAP